MGANIQGGAAPHPRDDPRVTRRLRKLYAERAPIDARDASSLWWRGPSDQIDRKDLEMAVLRHELGAEAAWMGTRFIVAEESTAHPEYEDRMPPTPVSSSGMKLDLESVVRLKVDAFPLVLQQRSEAGDGPPALIPIPWLVG